MITIKINGNLLDRRQSINNLVKEALAEMKLRSARSCTVAFVYDDEPGGTIKFRMTLLLGSSRPQRRPG